MQINQEQLEFKPITITIETKEEAEALRDIVEHFESREQAPSEQAWELVNKISNSFFDCEITY